MTATVFVWRNLWRNRTRTLLTVTSLAISLFLFTMLMATLSSMRSVAAASAAKLRLVVQDKTTMTKLLPMGQGPHIAALPGVESVCSMRWFGGRPERARNSSHRWPLMSARSRLSSMNSI